MIKLCIEKFLNLKSRHGFTLIELLIVFSIMTILSSVGVAAFVNYSRAQEVQATIQDIQTTLFTARTRALAQVKQGTCATSNPQLQLQGYEVLFCCSFAGCPTCYPDSNNVTPDYEMNIVCADPNNVNSAPTHQVMYSKKFPHSTVSFSNANTTASSYFFEAVSGAVYTNASSGTSQIGITGYGITKIAKVAQTGVIQ